MSNNVYTFACGCKLPILNDEVNPNTGLPSLDIDFDNLPLECEEVWKAFGEGNTQGVFQLESKLGIDWVKNIKPNTIEDCAAIGALLRPGPLNGLVDGVPMTQLYADRKNGKIAVTPIDESIRDILKDTYQVIVYQEQFMKIAQELAGFTLVQVDALRKAAGKKDQSLMAKVGIEFLEGCKKVGKVSEEVAQKIWDAIKTAGRYSFNKSHSTTYALVGYQTLWIKTHFPLHFYTSWLIHAKYKMKPKEEIRKLVRDAKYNDVTVLAPTLALKPIPSEFSIRNKHVVFGVRDIKKIGQAQLTKLVNELGKAEVKCGKTIDRWTWFDFLTKLAPVLGKSIVHGIISVGGLDFLDLSRRYMLFEYNTYEELTDREKGFILSSASTSLCEALEYLLTQKIIEKRQKIISDLVLTIKNPPSALDDSPVWINKTEQDLLGIPLTNVRTTDDAYDVDTTCREFNEDKNGTMILSVEISNVRETTIKNGSSKGEKMAFIDIEDDTASISAVAFSKEWAEYNSILYRGNTVVICGTRSKKGSFVISKARQI